MKDILLVSDIASCFTQKMGQRYVCVSILLVCYNELAQSSANSTFLERKNDSRDRAVNTVLFVCCRGFLNSHNMIMIRKYHDVM